MKCRLFNRKRKNKLEFGYIFSCDGKWEMGKKTTITYQNGETLVNHLSKILNALPRHFPRKILIKLFSIS